MEKFILLSFVFSLVLPGCGGKILHGRGEIFQGGDDIILALANIRDAFFATVRKKNVLGAALPVCSYAHCPPGRDSRLCQRMAAIVADTARRNRCETFVNDAISGWLSAAEEERIVFEAGETGNGLLAETTLGENGTIVFDEDRAASALEADDLTAEEAVIHEITHKSLVDGEFPSDDSDGRDTIDDVATAMAFVMADSRDIEAFLVDIQFELTAGPGNYFNWGGENETWMRTGDSSYGNVYIKPDGSLWKWTYNTDNLLIGTRLAGLTPLYHFAPALLYNAARPDWIGGREAAETRLAKHLDTHYQLRRHDNGLYQNSYGYNEKWMATPDVNTWYYLTPDGSLYYWHRTAAGETHRQVYVFSTIYWENPALLYDANAPQ